MDYLDIRRKTNMLSINIADIKITKPLTNEFFDNREQYISDFIKFFNDHYRDCIIRLPIDKPNVELFLSIINNMGIIRGYIEEKNKLFYITVDDNGFTILSSERSYCENIFYYLSKYFE